MNRKSRENPAVKKFIINVVDEGATNIASLTASQFGFSRVTANNYLHKLIDEKILIASGETKARHYQLHNYIEETFTFNIDQNTEEDRIWRTCLAPHLQGVKENIYKICQFGVTEMINNVIDHAESKLILIWLQINAKRIAITITDQGVGIFEKIRVACHLSDPRHALLELSKGKLTTDAERHSGEGIFFTSRMFNTFSILSGNLFYQRKLKDNDDWLIEAIDQDKSIKGTMVTMEIDLDSEHTTKEIFDKFTDAGDDYRFSSTHVPVFLARYGTEQLVSRSQAKRVLARFDKFNEVLLDFTGVDQIGQGFADEIFRVFKRGHPTINIYAVNTSPEVEKMIQHVQSNKD